MPTFNGQLNTNHIQSALFNMIISQDVIGGSIKNNYNLVDQAKEQVGLFGDTKLYIDVPTIDPVDWVQDSEDAVNLLQLHRPAAPKTQAITIDKFKQVRLTKDDYLSKQAFGTEGAFVTYQSVLDSRLAKSKEVYLTTTYNAFLGNVEGEVSTTVDLDADNNTTGENIAYALANLIDDMKDYGYEYTKNGFLRAFGDDEIKIVWNNKFINAVRKIDLPSIFHSDALAGSFVGDVLPSRYFGSVNTEATVGDGATVRSLIDQYITTEGTTTHYYAGELIKVTDTAPAKTSYTTDENIICKVFTKLPPVLEAFSVGTNFFNAKNLSTNMYLTFGHNTLEALDSEAIVTVKAE